MKVSIVALALVVASLASAGARRGVVAAPAAVVPPGWTADQRLTSDPAASQLSYNFARAVVADPSGGVHAVWYDTRGGVSQIFYKRSTDAGTTWGPDTPLSASEFGAEHPAIAVSGAHVFVAWHDFRNAQPDIYLRISADGGATWGSETRLTAPGGYGAHPSIAASEAYVRSVWGSTRDGQAEVYSRGSTDYGATWDAEVRLSETPYESWVSTVELSGPRAYVGWVDYRDANEEEYLRRSDDAGVTWGPVTRLTNDAADSWAPSIAISGETVHFLWFDRRDAGVSDVDIENKLNEALALVGLPVSAPPARDPAVYYIWPFTQRIQDNQQAVLAAAPGWVAGGGDPGALQAIMMQFQALYSTWTMGWEIYYKRSIDGGVTWTPDTRLTNASGLSERPSVAASGSQVYVVWFDGRGGDLQVFSKHSPDDGVTWEPDVQLSSATGNPLAESMHPSIAVGSSGVHVIWYDLRDGNAEIYYKRCVNACTQPAGSSAPRTYAMGWGPTPPVLTTASRIATIQAMSSVSEYALLQEEVPWAALLAGGSISAELDNKQPVVDYLRSLGMKIVWLVDPLDGLDRTKEPPDLVAAGHSLLEPPILAAHEAWVRAVAQRFHPEYFGLASEINTLAAQGSPMLYNTIVSMVNTLTPDIHALDPGSQVFVSFQMEVAWQNDGFPLIADFNVDALGLSSYPSFPFAHPADIPDNYYQRFTQSTSLPLLQVEGGWSSVSSAWGGGSPTDQALYVARVGALLDGVHAKLWLGIVYADLNLADPSWNLPPDRLALLQNFASQGITTSDFTPKPAYAAWTLLFDRPLAAPASVGGVAEAPDAASQRNGRSVTPFGDRAMHLMVMAAVILVVIGAAWLLGRKQHAT